MLSGRAHACPWLCHCLGSLAYIVAYNAVIHFVQSCNLQESVECAGTYYGQELYKVTLLSIAATIFGQLILRFGYFYWFNKKKEFLIADAVLAVVYIQSVVWVSTCNTGI